MTEDWKPNRRVLKDITRELNAIKGNGKLIVEDKQYSPSQILDEIRRGTDFGREFYEAHCRMREYFGWGRK